MDLIGSLMLTLVAGAAVWLVWNLVLFLMAFLGEVRSNKKPQQPAASRVVAPPESSVIRSNQSAPVSRTDVPANDPGAERGKTSTVEVNVALHGERRVRAFAEDVIIPSGAKVRTKRARTLVHALTLDWGRHKGVDLGIQHIVKSSVQKAIEERHGREIQRTEHVEYEIELNGELAQHYRLVWTDVLLTGVTSLGDKAERIPFEFVERTQLEVVAVTGDGPANILLEPTPRSQT